MKTENSQTETQKSKKSLMGKVFSLKTLTYLLIGSVGILAGVAIGVPSAPYVNSHLLNKKEQLSQENLLEKPWDKDAFLYYIPPLRHNDLNDKDYQKALEISLSQVKDNNNKILNYWLDYLNKINTEKLSDGTYKYDKVIERYKDYIARLNNEVDQKIKEVVNGDYKKNISDFDISNFPFRLQAEMIADRDVQKEMLYNWALKHIPANLVDNFKQMYQKSSSYADMIPVYAFAYYYTNDNTDIPPKPMLLYFQFMKQQFQNTRNIIPLLKNNFLNALKEQPKQ